MEALEGKTKNQLLAIAKNENVKYKHNMKKDELIGLLTKHFENTTLSNNNNHQGPTVALAAEPQDFAITVGSTGVVSNTENAQEEEAVEGKEEVVRVKIEEEDKSHKSRVEELGNAPQMDTKSEVKDFLIKNNFPNLLSLFEKEEILEINTLKNLSLDALRSMGMSIGPSIDLLSKIRETFPENDSWLFPMDKLQSVVDEMVKLSLASKKTTPLLVNKGATFKKPTLAAPVLKRATNVPSIAPKEFATGIPKVTATRVDKSMVPRASISNLKYPVKSSKTPAPSKNV